MRPGGPAEIKRGQQAGERLEPRSATRIHRERRYTKWGEGSGEREGEGQAEVEKET